MKIKPYISRCHGVWEVLDANSEIAFQSRDYDRASAFYNKNYKTLRAV